MVIDSSVFVAIVLGEEDASRYIDVLTRAIDNYDPLAVPASVIAEAGFVLDRRGRAEQFDKLVEALRPEVIPINAEIAAIARRAYGLFGRGIHEAKLNFGDCLVYGACVYANDFLLFKGDDFSQTDIRRYRTSPI